MLLHDARELHRQLPAAEINTSGIRISGIEIIKRRSSQSFHLVTPLVWLHTKRTGESHYARMHKWTFALSFVPESYPAASGAGFPVGDPCGLCCRPGCSPEMRPAKVLLPERFTHPGLTPSALSSCETVSPYAIIRQPYVFLLTPLNRVTLRPVNQKNVKKLTNLILLSVILTFGKPIT